MYAVFYLMQAFGRLRADGTAAHHRRPGARSHGLSRHSGAHAGPGKIQITLQNRLIEYDAVTAGGTLPTGTRVVVVDVVRPGTVEVACVEEPGAPGLQDTRAHV